MKSSPRLGTTVFPAAVVFVVTMMVIPLPTWLLDLLLTVNIAASVLLLLASIAATSALDLSAFPSLILITTLFRLGLNISSTRLILGQGNAGEVIAAFGGFVIQGSLVVGLVVFLILVVIQFVVITNGANRVAEVAARFTLDALPGKQMAIDADLNAGIIDENEARRRRESTAAEADFYGAMDGAGKFVKGDAIAAIVITTVNLIGGLIIGIVQNGMDVAEAVNRYSLMTVGDGLVSQIPALLVSISSGLIVTRAAGQEDLGTDVVAQFAKQHRALRTGGLAILCLGILPGLPKVPFLVVGATFLIVGQRLSARAKALDVEPEPMPEPPPDPDSPDELARTMRVDPVALELAVDLVDLVDPGVGGDLLDRVKALRRKLAMEMGFVLPSVRTRDDLDLPLGSYVIRIHGVEVGRGVAPPGQVLVIADDLAGFPGMEIREAVFGLPAKWVPAELRRHAELEGATVVDRSAVVTTHLAEVARTNAPDLVSRQEVKQMVDMVRESDPAVVEDLSTVQVGIGEVQKVIQDLLEEQVPVRDLVRILEVVSTQARVNRDPEALVEATRVALAPSICEERSTDGRLPVLSFEPLVEQRLLGALVRTERGTSIAVDPDLGEALTLAVAEAVHRSEQLGEHPVLVCSPGLRPAVRRFCRRVVPHLPVLSFDELAPRYTIVDMGVISVPNL